MYYICIIYIPIRQWPHGNSCIWEHIALGHQIYNYHEANDGLVITEKAAHGLSF